MSLRSPSGDEQTAQADGGHEIATLRRRIEELEKEWILEALERCGGNQTRAAKLLGMPRRTLVSRLSKYAVPRPRGSSRSSAAPRERSSEGERAGAGVEAVEG